MTDGHSRFGHLDPLLLEAPKVGGFPLRQSECQGNHRDDGFDAGSSDATLAGLSDSGYRSPPP